MFNFSQLTRGLAERKPVSKSSPGDDSLDAFGSEEGSAKGFLDEPEPVPARTPLRPGRPAVIAAIAVIVLALGVSAAWKWRPFQLQAASASLTIESDPAGADVISGGEKKGTTPLTLSVTPGAHAFELVYGERRKSVTAIARAGALVVHHVELEEPVAAPLRASLRVVTDPAGLRVAVDGEAKGTSPLTLDDVEAGVHKVQVTTRAGTVEREVTVQPGEAASVIIGAAPAAPAGPAAGWLSVSAPIELQILEGANLIGTSETRRILLPVGRHELQLVSEPLGFSERRTVQVTAGANASLRITVPTVPLSLNAVPWAEAFVDGQRVGETPIGNHPVRIGTHEILFRHPEHGERRQTVTVGLKTPARVSVDMRRPQ